MNFKIGQVVHHKLFDYRGVVLYGDQVFSGSDQWYDTVARSKPPKDQPWYHVLVHNQIHTTYVAERNLELDTGGGPIDHPLLPLYFGSLKDGNYSRTNNWSGDTPLPQTINGRA